VVPSSLMGQWLFEERFRFGGSELNAFSRPNPYACMSGAISRSAQVDLVDQVKRNAGAAQSRATGAVGNWVQVRLRARPAFQAM